MLLIDQMRKLSLSKYKIAVLASGNGSNLQSIIDAVECGELANAEICGVITDRIDAYAITRARTHQIAAYEIIKKSFANKDSFNNALHQKLKEFNPDLIVLAGFLSIIPSQTVKEFSNKIINIHPSLIPKYCGMCYYGIKVHEAVIEANDTVSGATVHYVDEGVDTGKIIIQQSVKVEQSDTPSTLAAKVLEVEHKLIVEAIKQFINNKEKEIEKSNNKR